MNQAAPVARLHIPPAIARASVGARNALARHGEDLAWLGTDERGHGWRLSLDLAPTPTPTPTPTQDAAAIPVLTQVAAAGDCAMLRLWADGANVRLAIPRAALAAWLAAVFPGVGRADLDGWVMDGAVDCLLDFLRPHMRALDLPAGWQLDREDAQAPLAIETAASGMVVLTAPDAGETWPLALRADAGGLALLAHCLERRPAAGQDVWLDDVPIPLRAMVGYTDLTLGGLRRLASGDVVLLDRTLGGSRDDVCLLAPDGRALRLAAAASDQPGGRTGLAAPYLIVADWISIMSPEEKENYPEDDDSLDFDGPDVDEDDDAPDAGDAPSAPDPADSADGLVSTDAAEALDAIPVRLGFDLGARGMPLGEVRCLRPGQILVLDCELATAPVSIRANGRCIGHGELVDIDGRLGVRIVDLRRKRA